MKFSFESYRIGNSPTFTDNEHYIAVRKVEVSKADAQSDLTGVVDCSLYHVVPWAGRINAYQHIPPGNFQDVLRRNVIQQHVHTYHQRYWDEYETPDGIVVTRWVWTHNQEVEL